MLRYTGKEERTTNKSAGKMHALWSLRSVDLVPIYQYKGNNAKVEMLVTFASKPPPPGAGAPQQPVDWCAYTPEDFEL
jgi:hypothetical protein